MPGFGQLGQGAEEVQGVLFALVRVEAVPKAVAHAVSVQFRQRLKFRFACAGSCWLAHSGESLKERGMVVSSRASG